MGLGSLGRSPSADDALPPFDASECGDDEDIFGLQSQDPEKTTTSNHTAEADSSPGATATAIPEPESENALEAHTSLGGSDAVSTATAATPQSVFETPERQGPFGSPVDPFKSHHQLARTPVDPCKTPGKPCGEVCCADAATQTDPPLDSASLAGNSGSLTIVGCLSSCKDHLRRFVRLVFSHAFKVAISHLLLLYFCPVARPQGGVPPLMTTMQTTTQIAADIVAPSSTLHSRDGGDASHGTIGIHLQDQLMKADVLFDGKNCGEFSIVPTPFGDVCKLSSSVEPISISCTASKLIEVETCSMADHSEFPPINNSLAQQSSNKSVQDTDAESPSNSLSRSSFFGLTRAYNAVWALVGVACAWVGLGWFSG